MKLSFWLTTPLLLANIIFFRHCYGYRRSFAGSGGIRTEVVNCPPAENVLPCVCVMKTNEIHVSCENSEIGKVGSALEFLKREEVPVEELHLVANRIPSIPARFFASLQVKKLFLIDNELVGISRNAFAGLESSLEHVYIHETILQDLPFDTFDNLKQLRTLVMEETAITEIPRLFSLPQLESLKVDHSQVSKLPTDAFTHMPSMKKVEVINSNLENLRENAMDGLIYLKDINFSNNNISWVHPGAFRTLEMVEELTLAGNKIEEVAAVVMATRELRSLKVLDISRNRIRQLKQGTFVDMTNLETVNLARNNIQIIHPEAMYKLPNLKKLDLSNNELLHFEANIFTDVPSLEFLNLASNNLSFLQDMRYIYRSLPNLRELDLSGNYLKAGNEIYFGGHSKLETLILSYNFLAKLSKNLFRGLPNLRELYLNHNIIQSDVGDQVWDLPKLRVLDISHNDLENVEQNMLAGLPQLNELKLSFNLISEISPKSFENSSYLKYLNMSYNKITKLHPNTFHHVADLYELDLSYNGIQALEAALFDGLSSLEFLHAFHNQIMSVDGIAFRDTVKLRHLDLSDNLIKAIPADALRKLTSLRTLNLRKNAINSIFAGSFNQLRVMERLDVSNNHIQSLDQTAFTEMNVLKDLDLSVNYIQYLGPSLFSNMKLIEKLNISNNFITEIGHEAFKSLKRLRLLDLTNNSLTTIGQSLQDMPSLQGLFMNHNYINKLTNSTFINLPSLNVLFFGNNGLQIFEIGTFYNLTSLMHLDLRNNSLVELKSFSFSSLSSLKELKLSQNQISLIEDYAFINLEALQSLELQDNVITHIGEYAFDMLPSLKFLNLSRNGLQNVPGKALGRISTLDVLDLSWNYILEVKDSSFKGLHWLTVLILNDNDLCHLSVNAFKGPRSLRVLMLHNNQMKKLHLSALREPIRSLSLLDMSGNPFLCDCELVWLREYLQEEESHMNYLDNIQSNFRGSAPYGHTTGRGLFPAFPSTMHGEPQCAGPPEYAGRPITEVPPEAFLCNSLREDSGLEQCVPRFLNPSMFSSLGESGVSTDLLNTLLKLSNLSEILPLEGEAPSYLDYNNPIVVSGLPNTKNLTNKSSLLAPAQPSNSLYDASSQLNNGITSGLGGVSNDYVTGDTPTIYAGPSPEKSTSNNDESKRKGGLFGFKLPALPNILESLGKFKLPNLGLNVDWGTLPFGRLEGAKPARGPDNESPIWVHAPGNENHIPTFDAEPSSEQESSLVASDKTKLFPPRTRGNGNANPKQYPLFSDPVNFGGNFNNNLVNTSVKDNRGSFSPPTAAWSFDKKENKYSSQEHQPSRNAAVGPGPNAGTPFLPGLMNRNHFANEKPVQQGTHPASYDNGESNDSKVSAHTPVQQQHDSFTKEKWNWSPPETIDPSSGISFYPPTSSFRPMHPHDPNSPIVIVDGPNNMKEAPTFDSNGKHSPHNPFSSLSNKVSSTTADILSSDLDGFYTGNNQQPLSTSGEKPYILNNDLVNSYHNGVGTVYHETAGQPSRSPTQDLQNYNRGVGSVINVDLEEYGRKSLKASADRNVGSLSGQPTEASSSKYDHWTRSFENNYDNISTSTIPSTTSVEVTSTENTLLSFPNENKTFVPLSHSNGAVSGVNDFSSSFDVINENSKLHAAENVNSSLSSTEGKNTLEFITGRNFNAHNNQQETYNVDYFESNSRWPPTSLGEGVSVVEENEAIVPDAPLATGVVEAVSKSSTHNNTTNQVSPSRSIGKFNGVSSIEKVADPNFVRGVDLPPQYDEREENLAIDIITEATPEIQRNEHHKQAGNMDWYFSNYNKEYDPESHVPIGGNGPPPNAANLMISQSFIQFSVIFIHSILIYKYSFCL